jgi:hypothetical protein
MHSKPITSAVRSATEDRLLTLFGLFPFPFGSRALLSLVFCDDLIGVFNGEL